jgi:hypothetical protein
MAEIIATNGGDAKARHTVVVEVRVPSPASRRSWPTHARHQQHTHA